MSTPTRSRTAAIATDDGPLGVRTRRPLADVAQTAGYLGDTIRHVRKLVFERRIPTIKVGGKLRFDLDAIDAWLDEHSEAPEPLPRPTGRPRW